MIYEFGDAELRLAFYDGLGARPESFISPTGQSDPMLVVVTLDREEQRFTGNCTKKTGG